MSDAQKAIGLFRNDLQNQYAVFNITHQIIESATTLPQKHKLRAYDAVQLAAALEISTRSTRLGIPLTGMPALTLISSDGELLDAARAEGLPVDDPQNYP